MRREWVQVLAGAGASALLLGLFARAEAPFHWLGFVALVPWLVALDRAARLGPALGSAVALALGFTASGFAWFPPAVAGYAQGSGLVAWGATLLLAPLVIQPQLVVYAAARHLLGRAPRLVAALAAACAYVGAEWALPKLFSDSLGYGLYPSETLRQAADLGGVRGLTLLLILANEALAALAAARRNWAPAALAAAVLAAAALYGGRRLDAVRGAPAATLTAGVVQANITRYDKLAAEQGTYETVAAILDAHFALSERLLSERSLDLLLWPETMYPTTYGAPRSEAAADFDRAIAGFVAARGVPLVLGAFEREGDAEYNAAFFLSPTDRGVEHVSYRKSLLFPMTEAVPGWLDGPLVRRALPWTGRWRPGPGAQALPLRLGGRLRRVGPLICYEVTDVAYVARAVRAGADLLVTLSNDAWFTDARAPRLHLVMAALRSVETRRAQLRATNSGISALILPDGNLVEATPFAARAAFAARVPLVSLPPTPVVRWGDVTGPGAAAGAGLLGLLAWRTRRWRWR
jgi:apolipoprotein N-acyltransferase